MSRIDVASDVKEKLDEILNKLTNFSDFEDEWDEGYLEDDINCLLGELEVTVGMTIELKHLYTLCQSNHKVYDRVGKYIAYSNVHLRLIERSQDEDIQPFMQPFYEEPRHTIDHLMKLANLFQLFGRTQLAITLCERVFTPIAADETLFTRPEDRLAKIICFHELQKMYIVMREGTSLDWQKFDAAVRPYGYTFTTEDYNKFEQIRFVKIDAQLLAKQFKKAFKPAVWDLITGYCCYMWDEKKMPFGTSEALTTIVFNFLISRLESPNCGVEKFFTFNEDELEEHLMDIIGLFLPYFEDAFALIWAIPSLYSYLHSIGLLEERILRNAIKITDSIKKNLISDVPFSHEVYHFTQALELKRESGRD